MQDRRHPLGDVVQIAYPASRFLVTQALDDCLPVI
jgi:hypothetical protein